MAKLLLLSADRWEMTDENTGEILKGISVHAVSEHREPSSGAVGFKPVKLNVDASKFGEIQQLGLPALVNAEYDLRPIAGGKAGLTIVGFKKIKSLDLFNG